MTCKECNKEFDPEKTKTSGQFVFSLDEQQSPYPICDECYLNTTWKGPFAEKVTQ